MSRWFVSLPETTCIFPDVLAWPARRTTSGLNGRRDNKFFSHSSYIRAEIPSPRLSRVRTKSRNTRETRKRDGRRETEERRTVERLAIPLEKQCSWSRTSGSRTVASHRWMTGRIPACIVVHPSRRAIP